MKQVKVVAAIIFHKEKILCVQRGVNKYDYISKKYEFPGGKIESGETDQEALGREIEEELSMNIEVDGHEFLEVNHQYPDFFLTMHSYICRSDNDELILHEHIDHKWLTVAEMDDLDWAAADIPIVQKLKNLPLNG